MIKLKLKDMDYIIKSYKPQKGFIDLSTKPKNLSKRNYAKILRMQMFLIEQNKKLDYLKQPYNKNEFDKLKELSATFQQIIFEYWGIMG